MELTTKAYRSSGAILIPSDAVYFDEGNAYVYVARDGAAVRTEVTVGLYTADTIAVTAGLTAGDEVITTWSAGLKDGAPIRLVEARRRRTAGPQTPPVQPQTPPVVPPAGRRRRNL